ncbi:MAG: 4-phosphoerythronate dehydrogenase [Paludibacteraceae bacterium]|nr:4-phosphoerythronate dehydrogenase [Paludibacteraceae bacterium]
MLVLADNYIPFLKGILEPFAELRYLEPEDFTPETVRDADALLVRTRTRCNEALLVSSRVQFVATATIGYDHIDTRYCEMHGIRWTNSPGCNAEGVCDYVEEVLRTLCLPQNAVIGVVGVGHVGSLVAAMAERRGMRVLLNDPPKGIGVPLDIIAREADVITFHTPLVRGGEYPTSHLADAAFLAKCRADVVLINAARGGVLDEQAALLEQHSGKTFVIDTWEGEPRLNIRMLERARLASYHIAGYTLQGKVNATNMCLAALCRHFSLPPLQVPADRLPAHTAPAHGWLSAVDRQLRAHPDSFETLRETYPLR